MLKDLFLNEVESAIEFAIKNNTLGQMTEYTKGSLAVEKPKNADVATLLRNISQTMAKIQSSGIAAISERRETEDRIVLTITIPKN